jgi:hypothetical protein
VSVRRPLRAPSTRAGRPIGRPAGRSDVRQADRPRSPLCVRELAVYNAAVTLTFAGRLRGAGIALLVVLVASLGARPARAADPATTGAEDKKPAAGAGDAAAEKSTQPLPAAVQQVETDEEGPSTRVSKKVRHGMRPQPAEDVDEKPFWKSWIFWSVTGVLVAGAVGAVIYSTSGTKGSVGPCPANVALSLGCYGAGRM